MAALPPARLVLNAPPDTAPRWGAALAHQTLPGHALLELCSSRFPHALTPFCPPHKELPPGPSPQPVVSAALAVQLLFPQLLQLRAAGPVTAAAGEAWGTEAPLGSAGPSRQNRAPRRAARTAPALTLTLAL